MEVRVVQAKDKLNTEYKNVLVAVVGMSPAILTESVWALAHEKNPAIPEQIVLITTVPGMRTIQELLLDNGAWNRMIESLSASGVATKNRLRFGAAQDHIRLLPSSDGRENIADITTPESSAAAADFIMKTLREFTENPETRVNEGFDPEFQGAESRTISAGKDCIQKALM